MWDGWIMQTYTSLSQVAAWARQTFGSDTFGSLFDCSQAGNFEAMPRQIISIDLLFPFFELLNNIKLAVEVFRVSKFSGGISLLRGFTLIYSYVMCRFKH